MTCQTVKISDIIIPKYHGIFNNKNVRHIILTSGRAGTKSSYAAIRSDYQIVSDPHGKDMPSYSWQSKAPWYKRLENAIKRTK